MYQGVDLCETRPVLTKWGLRDNAPAFSHQTGHPSSNKQPSCLSASWDYYCSVEWILWDSAGNMPRTCMYAFTFSFCCRGKSNKFTVCECFPLKKSLRYSLTLQRAPVARSPPLHTAALLCSLSLMALCVLVHLLLSSLLPLLFFWNTWPGCGKALVAVAFSFVFLVILEV